MEISNQMHRSAYESKNGVTKSEVAKFAVNYKDVFDLKYLYLLMHEWLVEEGFCDRDDSKFREVFYFEKEDPAAGKFYHFRWRFTKERPLGSTLYSYDLDVNTMVLTLKDVELAIKGKKVKAQKGELEVQIVASLVEDPKGKFRKPWLKPFEFFIYKKLLRRQKEYHEDNLKEEATRFQESIKTYLKLETYLPEREHADFWRSTP